MKATTLAALALTLSLPLFAHAEDKNWAAELDQYKADIADKSNANLILRHAGNSAAAMAACSADVAIAGATFVADSTPVLNGLSEIVAHVVDEKYKTNTYQSIFSWEALTQMGRGIAGGGVVAVKDALKFVLQYLSGKEDKAFEGVKKMYASSMATTNALFAQQGKCMMSISKVLILRLELEKRGVMATMEQQN